MQRSALLAALTLPFAVLPARAQTPMPPAEFEAFSQGRTLYFTLDGQPFGAEQYFPGRRSLWRFAEGDCASGVWRAEGDLICFVYEGDIASQCWQFLRDGARLRAALIEDGAETGFGLDFSHSDAAPLVCPGPGVGS